MKKKTLRILALILALSAPLTACVLGRTKGPYDCPDSVWISEEPYIELHVSSNHVIEESEAFLMVDGEKIEVWVYLETNRQYVTITRSGDNGLKLISGTLGRVRENEVSFEVQEDHVYSGAYQTITFRRQTG